MDHVGELIDIVKIGWGIGYADPHLPARVAAYRRAGAVVSLGGTLLEVAAAQGRAEELRAWALEVGLDAVEVSNGLGLLDRPGKTKLIELFSGDFQVAAEVGSKNATVPVLARLWADEMRADLEAGARWVIAEGRESGTVGIYEQDGLVRDSVVQYLIAKVPVDRIIFEAPNKAQQAWFVRAIGCEVNLGNIAPDDVLPLETRSAGPTGGCRCRRPTCRWRTKPRCLITSRAGRSTGAPSGWCSATNPRRPWWPYAKPPRTRFSPRWSRRGCSPPPRGCAGWCPQKPTSATPPRWPQPSPRT
jgi:phosphosulfolactate synthase